MRSGGNREGCDNSRNGSVDAALQKQIPHNHSPENIKPTVAHPEEIPAAKYQQDTRRSNQVVHRQMRGVKKGDDQNAADIKLSGTRLPNRLSTPSEKAISVAIGMARPLWAGVPAVMK